jgi:hypothetical protein
MAAGRHGDLSRMNSSMRLSIFKLERYFANYEFSTKYLLCASDCESLSIAELLSIEANA